MFSIDLWYEAIRDIEGQFGSAVGSYFCMVRRLFALNLALTALWLGFVVVPQALHNEVAPTSKNETNWPLDWITGKVSMCLFEKILCCISVFYCIKLLISSCGCLAFMTRLYMRS